MLFNSFDFLLFLPIVFGIYWIAFSRNLKLQNLFIIVASYIFYGWWSWTFLLLLLFTSLTTYLGGIAINSKSDNKWNKLITSINIIVNILVLGIYKYYDFFVESFVSAFSFLGIDLSLNVLNLILPIGISFYTFQALSYSIDVYKKKITPEHDIIAFFSFVGFFPQLLAGPIGRSVNLLPQFRVVRVFNYDLAVDGMRQILWGAFKKIVVADNCASIVNNIFDNYQSCNSSTLLLGAFFFTFQIYGDFSGYSDMAVGISKLFGIRLMRNFSNPYFSRNIAEFWRNWHISLTTWFRDYIYIPLGGSRGSKLLVVRNTFIIFLISGLWHGANWTFVIWGLYHALLFMPLLLLSRNKKNVNPVAEGKKMPTLKELRGMVTTFLLVAFGWIIFKSNDISSAYAYISKIFSFTLFESPYFISKKAFIFILILIVVEWVQRNRQHGLELSSSVKQGARYIIYFFIVFLILEYSGDQSNFIYFQF